MSFVKRNIWYAFNCAFNDLFPMYDSILMKTYSLLSLYNILLLENNNIYLVVLGISVSTFPHEWLHQPLKGKSFRYNYVLQQNCKGLTHKMLSRQCWFNSDAILKKNI